MIILVSDDQDQEKLLSAQLRQKGYLYFVAADEKRALDAARNDRASLVLIDTDCSSFDGFSLCRTLKTDRELSAIPVILMVSADDPAVMLKILDCTADSFIVKPCEPGTLWSAIDDLQSISEDKRVPRGVRTRFVVTFNGREYVVVADRRQLLEFLLTTFEAAVRIQSGQERMRFDLGQKIKDQSDRLSELASERDAMAKNLRNELEERSRTLGRLNTAIQVKDQQEALLRKEAENLRKELEEKDTSLKSAESIAAEQGARFAALESELADLLHDKENTGRELQRRIGDLERGLAAATASRDTEKQARQELEIRVQALIQEKDALEPNLRQTHAALSEVRQMLEKEQSSHQETRSRLAAALAERDTLLADLKSASSALTVAQEQVQALAAQKSDAEHGLNETATSLRARLEGQLAVLAALQASLAEEQRVRAERESELAELKEKHAGTGQFLDSASRDIGVLNTALAEEKAKTVKLQEQLSAALRQCGEKDRAIQALRDEVAALKSRQCQEPAVVTDTAPQPADDRGNGAVEKPARNPPAPERAPGA
jgi:DNA-binding response OmpR family regulator/septal ring factor EnvC (AmiA/AmiB activator)